MGTFSCGIGVAAKNVACLSFVIMHEDLSFQTAWVVLSYIDEHRFIYTEDNDSVCIYLIHLGYTLDDIIITSSNCIVSLLICCPCVICASLFFEI